MIEASRLLCQKKKENCTIEKATILDFVAI